MPGGQINSVKVNLLRNLSIGINSQNNAVRISGARSRAEFRQTISQKNALTPQDIGNSARRISVSDNQIKNPQDRFFDVVA